MAACWPGEEWMFDEGRYAPEHDTDPPRPVPAIREPVGMSD